MSSESLQVIKALKNKWIYSKNITKSRYFYFTELQLDARRKDELFILLYSGSYLGDLEGLDFASVFDVRPSTQIDERSATVHRGGGGLHFLLQNPLLELVVL